MRVLRFSGLVPGQRHSQRRFGTADLFFPHSHVLGPIEAEANPKVRAVVRRVEFCVLTRALSARYVGPEDEDLQEEHDTAVRSVNARVRVIGLNKTYRKSIFRKTSVRQCPVVCSS